MTKVLSCGNEILGGAHMASNCRVGMVLWHHSCFVSSFQPWAAPLKTKPLCISAGKIGALHQNLKWLIDTVICNHCFGWALEWAAVPTLVVFKRRGWGLRGGLVMGLCESGWCLHLVILKVFSTFRSCCLSFVPRLPLPFGAMKSPAAYSRAESNLILLSHPQNPSHLDWVSAGRAWE